MRIASLALVAMLAGMASWGCRAPLRVAPVRETRSREVIFISGFEEDLAGWGVGGWNTGQWEISTDNPHSGGKCRKTARRFEVVSAKCGGVTAGESVAFFNGGTGENGGTHRKDPCRGRAFFGKSGKRCADRYSSIAVSHSVRHL